MYFQNEPSANPLRLLVNSRVGGHMLVNLKNVSKTSLLLNNNYNNGLNFPVTGVVKTKGISTDSSHTPAKQFLIWRHTSLQLAV